MLETIFLTIGRQLSQTLANPSSAAQAHARISRYYSPTTPVLRLVSGLSEGADTLAIDAFGRARLSAAQYGWSGEVGAVLPFDIATYRRSRPEAFRPVFDDLAPKCSYILTLDGIYDKPTPDTAWAKHRRSRAYRTQSNILLRHSDLLLAVAHLDEAGGAGGTLETIRAALALEMLVILVSPDTGATTLLEPGDDLTNVLTSVTPGEWQLRLSDWVTRIIADPDVPSGRGSDESTSAGTWHASSGRLLDEYFDAPAIPPTRTMKDGKLVRSPSLHGRCWTWFENQCRRGKTPKSDPSLEPYASWRSRATSLNYHYAELYRGAFLLNYLLAVCAVLLAGISLVFLSTHAQSTILLPKVLLALGALKLAIVVWILRNTHRANHGDWNDKAVDFRYLAERLRAMFYLPRIGSFHPPAPDPPQYASRAVRQSSVDWLFNAIVRSVSPAVFAKPATFAGHNAATREVRVLSLDSLGLLRDVRRSWLGEQAVYHDRNARTMGRMHEFAESASSWLSITVIVCVSADVLILLAEALHLMPEEWVHVTQAWTPWLVFLAALLPASVASLNGIRFQSECRRLAERSSVMRTILLGRSDQNGRIGLADLLIARIAAGQFEANTDPAAWSLDVLRLTETVATDFIQEASEWSVVYAKEMPDPG